jgi:hypothetical protein
MKAGELYEKMCEQVFAPVLSYLEQGNTTAVAEAKEEQSHFGLCPFYRTQNRYAFCL